MRGRPQEVLEATCSADKARKLLNYKTKTSLDDGLSKMIEYIKNKGAKKFRYHLDIEIINSKTPDTWKKKIFQLPQYWDEVLESKLSRKLRPRYLATQ